LHRWVYEYKEAKNGCRENEKGHSEKKEGRRRVKKRTSAFNDTLDIQVRENRGDVKRKKRPKRENEDIGRVCVCVFNPFQRRKAKKVII
jgi:hypothetical protein